MGPDFRTLNYLGSKLRLLGFLEDCVCSVTQAGAGVCDLFAGSGCVSYRLSQHFPVVSCDMQHYSKVICEALLKKWAVTDADVSAFFAAIDHRYQNRLMNSFLPLITLEEDAINSKDSKTLTEILEHGSVEVFNIERCDTSMSRQLLCVSKTLQRSGMDGVRSLISRYYGGVYFSYRQAVQIDVLLENIYENVREEDRSLFMAALLSTASDLANTVGKHFAQPIKARDSKGNIKSIVYNKAVKDKTINALQLYREWLGKYVSLSRAGFAVRTMQGGYLECLRTLSPETRTIYADPPYTRDHYSRFYHVLETIALRDVPGISTVVAHGERHVSNGIYRVGRYQSPFCIKSKALPAFEQMFLASAEGDRNLLLSYSPYDQSKSVHPRVVTVEQLISLSHNYYKNVDVVSAGSFHHNKLNSVAHRLEAEDEAEIVIVCRDAR